MKYIKADIPCNFFYFVLDDSVDVANLTFDLVTNTIKDINGDVVKPSNTIYCMGANEGTQATITQVEALPFPDDTTI